MKQPVFSLRRLAESRKTMRTAAAVALMALTAPAYSAGLSGLVKGVADHTTLYLYAERNEAPLSQVRQDRHGFAAIVYSPVDPHRGLVSQSSARVAQVATALDGRFTVADLTPGRDYTLNAAKKGKGKGITSGAIIGGTMVVLGIGLFAWMTNDDGNRDRD